MNRVVMINVDQLKHHPKNPREEIGDVTELADSIKQNGILQNLTVYVVGMHSGVPVEPFEDDPNNPHHRYYVLIGNRRLEAAKAAGLTEVPCVIAPYMSEAEQVSMMMQENMQRENLTFVEEAFGFQMMLDLGENINSIARKTGFSDTTVRTRTKIAQLDKDVLKDKVENFQLTLSDFAKLNEVDDVKERNKILKDAKSSNDLKWRAERYVESKKKEADREKMLALLEEKGIEHLEELDDYSPSGWSIMERQSPSWFIDNPETARDIDWESVEGYGIYNGGYNSLIILAKRESEDEKEEDPKERELRIRRKKWEDLKEYIDGETKEVGKDMDAFTKKIISGEIKSETISASADPVKMLWNLARDMNEYISFNTMEEGLSEYGYFSDLEAELGEGDALDIAIAERMKEISVKEQLTAGILYEGVKNATGGSVMDWRYRRSEWRINKMARAYNVLHIWGYEYKDDETKDLMQGRGVIWDKVDALEKEEEEKENA